MFLSLDRVEFGYRATPILHGVTFHVAAGEMVGLIGPNGSGKTTILRLVSKVLAPRAGTIALAGRDVRGLSRVEVARTVAVVPQHFEVAFALTVRDLVSLGRLPHGNGLGVLGQRDREAIDGALAATGIEGLAGARIDELSGGERQLASIARALAQEPKLLLLDEPTAHLDLAHQAVIMGLIARLHREAGLTTLLVSHDLNLAGHWVDRLVLLDAGRVRRVGRPEEVLEPETLRAVYGEGVRVTRDPADGRPWVLPSRAAEGRFDRKE